MFRVNNKKTPNDVNDVVVVSLFLTLNVFHISIAESEYVLWCFPGFLFHCLREISAGNCIISKNTKALNETRLSIKNMKPNKNQTKIMKQDKRKLKSFK